MSEYIPDNLDLYAAHEAEQQRKLEKFPKCEFCGEPLTEEYCFDIGDVICTNCLIQHYRMRVEDLVF